MKILVVLVILFIIDGKWLFLTVYVISLDVWFLFQIVDTEGFMGSGVFDINLFRCMLKKEYSCPHEDIDFVMYTP